MANETDEKDTVMSAEEIVRRIEKKLAEESGQAILAEVRKKANETSKQIREAVRVDPADLRKPVTL